jgi:glutamine synthetase
MLMAGLDGVARGLDAGAPSDYDLFEAADGAVPQVPGSLTDAVDALEADHAFLLEGGVFTPELIETWIAWKREEADLVRLRPHPAEFHLYYDA